MYTSTQLPGCYALQPPPLRLKNFQSFQLETLFYIFYSMPRDVLQVAAATELNHREYAPITPPPHYERFSTGIIPSLILPDDLKFLHFFFFQIIPPIFSTSLEVPFSESTHDCFQNAILTKHQIIHTMQRGRVRLKILVSGKFF